MRRLLAFVAAVLALYTWVYESYVLGLITAVISFILGYLIGAERERKKINEMWRWRRW